MGRWVFLAIAGLVLTQVPARADIVSGTVERISSSRLNLTVYDPQGNPYPNALPLKVSNATSLKGMRTPSDIRPGDSVITEIRRETDGSWEAVSIEKTRSAPTGYRPPAGARSDPIMSALTSEQGKKILRNGLVGAAAGGLASGGSGGKAGKGALIGAGVGILGGLLTDMMSGESQQPAQPLPQAYTDPYYPEDQAAPPRTRIIRQYDNEGNLISEQKVTD